MPATAALTATAHMVTAPLGRSLPSFFLLSSFFVLQSRACRFISLLLAFVPSILILLPSGISQQ
jgi:hypothetical protein